MGWGGEAKFIKRSRKLVISTALPQSKSARDVREKIFFLIAKNEKATK